MMADHCRENICDFRAPPTQLLIQKYTKMAAGGGTPLSQPVPGILPCTGTPRHLCPWIPRGARQPCPQRTKRRKAHLPWEEILNTEMSSLSRRCLPWLQLICKPNRTNIRQKLPPLLDTSREGRSFSWPPEQEKETAPLHSWEGEGGAHLQPNG